MVGPIQGQVTKRKDESQPLDAWWNDEGVHLWTVWDTTSGPAEAYNYKGSRPRKAYENDGTLV